MTEIQTTINDLQRIIAIGNRLAHRLEKAQKDLETPPSHKWKHGDVFLNDFGVRMIYIRLKLEIKKEYVFCISGPCGYAHNTEDFLSTGKFLFNIKEKL